MKINNRREWLAIASYSLLSACGGGGDNNAPPGPPTVTTLTLSGPSSGIVNGTSAVFTVGTSGPVSANIVVTPSSGSGGGTFTPATITLTTAAPTATFTYTPATTGVKTISVSNTQGLTNPANITYTAAASFTNPTFTNIGSAEGGDGTAQIVTTTVVTLLANRLALLSVAHITARSGAAPPTVAGWTLVGTHVIGDINRVSVFRRMSGTTSTQSFQIDFGFQGLFYSRWSIDQSSADVNTSGLNGSGAVVQVKVGGQVGTVQNCLLTFDNAFSNIANSTFAAFGGSIASATPTVGGGFTELARVGVEPFADRGLFVEYKAANDMTADMFWSATYDVWTGIAVEIAAGN